MNQNSIKSDGSGLYFVAAIPPQELETKIQQLKLEIFEQFESKNALKSPAHITFFPPFRFAQSREKELINCVLSTVKGLSPFLVNLNGFNSFPSNVVFIKPEGSMQLNQLNTAISDAFYKTFQLKKPGFFDHPFRPHITLASRDLKEADFPKCMNWINQKSFKDNFMIHSVYLLKHNGKAWDVQSEIKFSTD